jgi:hypothetical protein
MPEGHAHVYLCLLLKLLCSGAIFFGCAKSYIISSRFCGNFTIKLFFGCLFGWTHYSAHTDSYWSAATRPASGCTSWSCSCCGHLEYLAICSSCHCICNLCNTPKPHQAIFLRLGLTRQTPMHDMTVFERCS